LTILILPDLFLIHRQSLRFALWACASAWLCACATLTPPAPPQNSSAAPASLQGTRTGRISIRAPDARGEAQNWHAGFEFADGETKRTLHLTSPLGSTVARIEADAQSARLTLSNGEQTAYGSLAELTQRVTGVALPETAWRYWLQGVPAPGEVASQNSQGGFLQNGFFVSVVTRFDNGSPRVLEITRPDAPDLLVRVALEAAQ
jgi:outer membrane lipoprotein LolB